MGGANIEHSSSRQMKIASLESCFIAILHRREETRLWKPEHDSVCLNPPSPFPILRYDDVWGLGAGMVIYIGEQMVDDGKQSATEQDMSRTDHTAKSSI